MTKESICAGCAELVRVRVMNSQKFHREERICSINGIRTRLYDYDTVQECSRYVKTPEEH